MDQQNIRLPEHYHHIIAESEKLGFNMLSDLHTGCFLRTLAASKPGGRFLELGTGTGLSLSWLAEGADACSSLLSVDSDEKYQKIARAVFDKDKRISFECQDGDVWLESHPNNRFDLVFADAWPGKFENLDITLSLVKPGGFYLIDDLLPHPAWPTGHEDKVETLKIYLSQLPDFEQTSFNWSTGLLLLTRKAD